jgi:hypothetical protein
MEDSSDSLFASHANVRRKQPLRPPRKRQSEVARGPMRT